jgi:hypothetical protein
LDLEKRETATLKARVEILENENNFSRPDSASEGRRFGKEDINQHLGKCRHSRQTSNVQVEEVGPYSLVSILAWYTVSRALIYLILTQFALS